MSSSQYQQEVLLGDPLRLAIMGAAPSTEQSVPCYTVTESNSSLLVNVTMYDIGKIKVHISDRVDIYLVLPLKFSLPSN